MRKINTNTITALIKSGSLARFLSAGTAVFAAEYLTFYVLFIILDWNLFLSNSLSFGTGLFLSFILNRLWVFRSREYQRKIHHQITIYITLALLNLVMTNFIVGLLNLFGVDPRIGKLVAIGAIAAWNFMAYKYVIFAKHS